MRLSQVSLVFVQRAVVAAMVVLSPVVYAGFSFEPYVHYENNGSPDSLAIGDVTGDGLMDLVVVNNALTMEAFRNHVLIYVQQTGGTLAAPIALPYTTGTGSVRGVELAYLDDDDALEIVVGYSGGLALVNNLNGTFELTQVPAISENRIVVSSDVNRDGYIDLIGISISQVGTVYLNDHNGNIASQYEIDLSNAAGGNDLEVIDLHADSTGDLAVMNGGSSLFSHLGLYEQDGFGLFLSPQLYNVGYLEVTSAMAVGDFNNDGRDDVVLVRPYGEPNHSWLMLQQSNGTLAAPVQIASGPGPRVAESADVNTDGLMDLVTLHDLGSVGAFLGYQLQGPGGLQAPQQVALPIPADYELESLALGDVNGDGCTDAAVADVNHGVMVLHGRDCVRQADLETSLRARFNRVVATLAHKAGDAVDDAALQVSFTSTAPVSVGHSGECVLTTVGNTRRVFRCAVGAMQSGDDSKYRFQVSAVAPVEVNTFPESELPDPNPANDNDSASLGGF